MAEIPGLKDAKMVNTGGGGARVAYGCDRSYLNIENAGAKGNGNVCDHVHRHAIAAACAGRFVCGVATDGHARALGLLWNCGVLRNGAQRVDSVLLR